MFLYLNDMNMNNILLHSGEIVLMPAEYANFWESISKERATCARYMARIVILLLSFEKDPVKTEKSLPNKKYGSTENFITLLLNTLQFLDMFVGYDPSTEAFVSAMENYEQAKRTTPMFRNKRIDDGLYGLARRRANRGQAAVKMLVDCSTLESEEEMRQSASTITSTGVSGSLSDKQDNSDFSVDNAVMDFPFTFTALTRMSRADVSPLIFDEVLKQLEGAVRVLILSCCCYTINLTRIAYLTISSYCYPPPLYFPLSRNCLHVTQGSALSSMAAMQGRTLALMFMLREFLIISPTADQAWMQRACEVLIGLYKWPKPYGVVARELLDFVSLERRAPGELSCVGMHMPIHYVCVYVLTVGVILCAMILINVTCRMPLARTALCGEPRAPATIFAISSVRRFLSASLGVSVPGQDTALVLL